MSDLICEGDEIKCVCGSGLAVTAAMLEAGNAILVERRLAEDSQLIADIWIAMEVARREALNIQVSLDGEKIALEICKLVAEQSKNNVPLR